MSISIPGIGAVPPIFAAPGAPPPYAQNEVTSLSASATTLAAETGAAAVVYEPGQADEGQSYTYANPDPASRLPAPLPAADDEADLERDAARPAPAEVQSVSTAGDASVVAAASSTIVPTPPMPDIALAPASDPQHADAAVPQDPATPSATPVSFAVQPVQIGQAEAHAQAVYAAVADAQIVGASISDLPKYA
jgi:hypothetical protein